MKQFNEMSNVELLALLVGEELASNIETKYLPELFGFMNPRSETLSSGEHHASYHVHPNLGAAKELLSRCFLEQMTSGEAFSSPDIVKTWLCTRIGNLEHEVFWCLWLDTQHRLITAEEMFRGTINQASVYPREIVKQALSVNAAAVILAHNHPSGLPDPSSADIQLTVHIKKVLDLVEVRLLDHFVIANSVGISFAERGLL